MPKVTIPGVGEVDFPDTMSGDEINIAAKHVHDETVKPFDVKAQNATMRANMDKQAGAGKQDLLADFATAGPLGDVSEGLNKGHEGNYAGAAHGIVKGVSKVLAPAALPAMAAAPAAAVGGLMLGAVGDYGGRKAASLVTDNPDYQDVAGDVGGLVGGIAGGAAGSKVGAVAGPALEARAVRLGKMDPNTRSHIPAGIATMVGGPKAGAAVEAIQSPAVNRIVGGILKRGTTADAAVAPVVGLDRHMPNKSPNQAVRLYGPSAEGVGVEPPIAVDRNMPNKSADSHTSFAAGADEVPASPVDRYMPNKGGGEHNKFDASASASHVENGPAIDHNTTPPSKTDEIPDAYRAQLIKSLADRRASKNAAFDADVASSSPLSPGASPQEVATSFAKSKGLAEPVPHDPVKVDPKFGKTVADAYEAMVHDPSDPKVKQAYDALARETKDQFTYVKAHTGLVTEPWTKSGQPYVNSKAMMADVSDNNHMWYFPSEKGFGSGTANAHPLLAVDEETGMPINDMLRIVHDYFAHAKGGHQFGASGEENAFLEHAKLYSPDALAALASETRGQNSWVNFGPNANLPPASRPFAPQKAGLLPPAMRGLNPENVTAGAVPLADATKLDSAVLADAGSHVRPSEAVKGALPNVQEAVARLKRGGVKVPADKIKITDMEVVDPASGATTTNGSGERGQVSAEDMARVAEMKTRGEKVVVRKGGKGGTQRELIDPKDIADYQPQPGEVVGRLFADGRFREIARGERAGKSPAMTPIAEQLKASLAARSAR